MSLTASLRKNIVILLAFALIMLLYSSSVHAADSVKIIINKKVNKLAFVRNGVVVRIFPVATGKTPGLTPEGTFKVVRKLVNPYYSKLKIPGGTPQNPLGVRWLGLDALGTSGGTYGVHGTNNPSSIGRYASAGCIRMYNKDVIWLYDNTPLQTPVEIINRNWDLEQKPVTVVVGGKAVLPEAGAGSYLDNGRVMVPVRVVGDTMGCTVNWDSVKREAVISDGVNTLAATAGSVVIKVNGKPETLEVPAVLKNGRMFLWVRPVAEVFSYSVKWNGTTRTVTLTKAVS